MRWQVGAVRVTRILEQEFQLAPERLLSVFDPSRFEQHKEWLWPHFVSADGALRMAHQALLVEAGGRRIIVDTCRGNDRPLPNGRGTLATNFLQELDRVVSRESVDTVLCTHLHYDHVGWNTMLADGRWVPTFPNAKYLFSRQDYEYWAAGNDDGNVDLSYSVNPIVEAGRHQLVEDNHRITDEVTLRPTPGHTPGHVSVWIHSQGREAIITGDCAHHPVQLVETTWSSHADVSPAIAAATRTHLSNELLTRGTLIIGTHFSEPTAGQLVVHRAGRRFVAADQGVQ